MKTLLAFFVLMLLAIIDTKAQTIDWTMKANPVLQSVNGIAFRADGQKIISGTNCHPASIRIYDVATGSLNWDYTVGSEFWCIMGVAFGSNSNYISAIEEFGNIFIFDNTGSIPVIYDTIKTGTPYAFSTTISPNNTQVAVGCSNGKMKIFNINDGTLVREINAHPDWVTCVAYAPNGTKIVTGGDDNRVKIWNNSGTLLFSCIGHTEDITAVKVTPDNNYVVSSSKDNKIKIWNISTGALVLTISGHTNDVNSIDISPDGNKIASASSDSTCKIWDFNNGNLLASFGVRDSGAINAIAWSPAGNKIATGNQKSDIVLWSIPATLNINSGTIKYQTKVFPNPSSNYLYVELNNIPVQTEIIIYNSLGQKLKSFSNISLQKSTLSIQDLNPGSYILEVNNNHEKTITRFNILR